MNFNFGEVLSRAWQIIWKHKVLWIFGILASCSQGSGRFNSGGNGGGGRGGTGPTNIPPQLERFVEWISLHAVSFIAITVSIVCIFWIIAIFLGTIGRIGLIRGTSQVEGGAEHLIFGQLFSESTPYFWRVFGLSLLVGLPFLLLFAVFAAAFVVFGISLGRGNNASALGLAGVVPLFLCFLCVLVPILFVISMIVRQAERAIILEGSPVLPALSRGWDIFRNNLGPIILMAIILAVIGLVAGFIIAIPIFIMVVPAIIAFAVGNGQNYTPLLIAGVLFCIYLPVSWLLSGILNAYTESAWTLTYIRLTGTPAGPDTDIVTPDAGTPPPPPADDGDKTIISSSHA